LNKGCNIKRTTCSQNCVRSCWFLSSCVDEQTKQKSQWQKVSVPQRN